MEVGQEIPILNDTGALVVQKNGGTMLKMREGEAELDIDMIFQIRSNGVTWVEGTAVFFSGPNYFFSGPNYTVDFYFRSIKNWVLM